MGGGNSPQGNPSGVTHLLEQGFITSSFLNQRGFWLRASHKEARQKARALFLKVALS